jgi:hypothetical protein
MSITFSSCFYIIKSKFDPSIYVEWMNNLFSIVNNFNLVIYTDESSSVYIDTKENPRIKIIIKPIEQFYNYKYKEEWLKNHENNFLLNHQSQWNSCWELNMLWTEKIWFVKESIERNYFNTEMYGWCDIGYFRNNFNHINTSELMQWPDPVKINLINKEKILYACVNNNIDFIKMLFQTIQNKNELGLPVNPIPPDQTSIAGGFFILHKDKIDWWSQTYEDKLELYFKHNYLVKDDQIIIADCVFSNLDNFVLCREEKSSYDNWFMFQRILNI